MLNALRIWPPQNNAPAWSALIRSACAHSAQTEALIALLKADLENGYHEASTLLEEETREWWLDISRPEAKSGYDRTTESFLTFLEHNAMESIRSSEIGIAQRAPIRLQIHGESVDPIRLEQIHKLDERLARQYEQTLNTLLKVRLSSPFR